MDFDMFREVLVVLISFLFFDGHNASAFCSFAVC